MRHPFYIAIASFALSASAAASTPNGFAVWSEGSDYDRTLYKMDLQEGVTPNLANMQKICNKGADGGDIQANISFDGAWVAFSRSLPGTSDGCGGNDYHSFDKWDIYIVRVDGSLPATPIRVDHGYWPSWGDDSDQATKTLYYSVYEGKLIKKATIGTNGSVSNIQVHYDVPTTEGDLHMMCSPDGQKVGFREGGIVKIITVANGNKVSLSGGCHPEWCSNSWWLMFARYSVGNCDGTTFYDEMKEGGDDTGLGQYHYGCSNDNNWAVTRVGGDSNNNQNDGYPIYVLSLSASAQGDATQTFTTHKEVKVSDAGNFPDIHVYTGPPQARIDSFTATPSTISEGDTSTLAWSTSNTTDVSIGGVGSGLAEDGSTTVSPSATTTYTITVQGEGGPKTQDVTVTVLDPGALHMKLDCGTETPVTDWERANQYVTGGSDYPSLPTPTNLASLTDPAPAGLYNSCRHGADHTYEIPVPSGTYLVRIHFADHDDNSRSMTYKIEGATVLSDYDPPQNAAEIKEYPNTDVIDGGLTIEALNVGGNDIFECGIEIIGGTTASPVLTTIEVTPATASVDAGATQAFTAAGYDQYGDPISASIAWSVSGGGAVSPASGTGTSFVSDGTNGTFTVTASSGAVSGAASVDVTGTIVDPTITLTSPNAGDVWYVGTTRRITWVAANLDQVVISCSTDNGGNWTELTYEVRIEDPEWCNYPWTIACAPSTQCLIHLEGYFGQAPTTSDVFEVRTVSDGDGDGMDDAWETDVFGDTTHDETTDADGDGATDYEEFMDGGDPLVADRNVEADAGMLSCAGGAGGGSLVAFAWLLAALAGVRRTGAR